MRRVLLISPHFPPDSSAATHRVRLLAPHLSKWGWDPTVLTLEPSAYHGGLDANLLRSVPDSLRVVRCGALSTRVARVRRYRRSGTLEPALSHLYRAASRLLRDESFDAVFITIFPAYTSILGPRLSRRFGVPFILDYQDPWIGAWGQHGWRRLQRARGFQKAE